MNKRQVTEEKNSGIIYMLKTDSAYRRKFVLTVCVCWSYVILGWSVLQIGTALPDLQELIRVDLETASWIFTVWSFGFIIGSLVSGRMYDHYNRLAIMMVNTITLSACCFCVPYCTNVFILLIIRLFSGFFAGGIDTGANTIVPTIWDSTDGQTYMQAMYLAYTLGGIFSPLATKPFMSGRYDTESIISELNTNPETRSEVATDNPTPVSTLWSKNNSLTDFDTQTNSLMNRTTQLTTERFIHYTLYMNSSSNVSVDMSTISSITELEGSTLNRGESRIHYAFITTGVIVLSSALPYALMSFLGNFDERATKTREPVNPETDPLNETKAVDKNHKYVSKAMKIWLIGLVAGINFVYCAIEDCIGGFLTTYCMFYLRWTKSNAVLLMSLYWVTSCLGGLSGIFVIKLIGPAKLLFLSLTVWNVSFVLAVIGNITRYSALTWSGFMGAGSAMVLVIPAIISWTNDNVCEITGKVSSVFMISSGLGIAVNPKFIGYMMEKYSYGNFVYVLMFEAILCAVLFGCSAAVHTCNRDKKDHTEESEITA